MKTKLITIVKFNPSSDAIPNSWYIS